MITEEEIDKYYEEVYKNEKEGTNLNINKQMKIDLQICCSELSRKSKKTITSSSVVRRLITRFLMENKKKN